MPRVIAEFVKVDGVLVPRRLVEEAEHEKRMGYTVDPSRLAIAMNREMRRKLERKVRREAKKRLKDGKVVHESPIIVPRPVGKSEALERVTQMLVEGMAEHTHPGTIVTLKSVLDRAEAAIVEKAWKEGRPVPRELIRRALEEIHKRGDAQRAAQRRK